VSALVFRRRHADRALVLFLSRNTRRLRLSPTALARSFSLIRVPPQLSVPTPLDRIAPCESRSLELLAAVTACAAQRFAPPGEPRRRFSSSFLRRFSDWFFPARFRFSASEPESRHGTASVASPRFPRRWISRVSRSAQPGGVASVAKRAAECTRVCCAGFRSASRSQSNRALVLVCPDVVTRVFALPDVLDLTVLLVFLLRVSGRCEPSSCAAGGTQSDRFFLWARHPKADASPGRVTA
jgi:hypothetical protein